jgi:hypothetical protein
MKTSDPAGRDVAAGTPREGEAGSALLELLVALALLALLCSYAVAAIRHLQSFDRALRSIEDANSIESVAASIRHTIEGSRAVFFTKSEAEARLAFIGEPDRISLVSDSDSRLELGGLNLVQIAMKEDEDGNRHLVEYRRIYRSSMPIERDGEAIQLIDRIESLQFHYFGSPDGGESKWYSTWSAAKILPRAVEVTVTYADRRRWPPMIVKLAAAF